MADISDVRPAIAIVAPSLEILGGQGIQARALVDALRRDRYSVNLVPINPRFPRHAQWLRRYPYLRTVLNEALYLSRLAQLRRADVVHVFSASYWSFMLAPVPAILAAKVLRKPAILHYHSGEAADHLTRWGRVVARLLPLVDEIVVPSSYLQHVFASHGYRARVIPNVIDISHFHYRERVPLQPRLLSVRNLERHYRVEDTIEAFVRLRTRYPEATLTVAGYGGQERELRRLVSRRDIGGIQFVGRVDPAGMPALHDAAHIFVNSSVIDNQPVSILEAFASGLPVVSTPTGDIAAMLRGGEAGLLIDPADPSGMADAVTRLLTEPGLSLQLARRAREEAQRYAWSRVRELWTTLYDEVRTPSTGERPNQTSIQRRDAARICIRSAAWPTGGNEK
jgi:glycosyltransferase involved in cell wall biosynthesis